MKKDEIISTEVVEEQPLRGRAKAIAAYKAANPDIADDPDDDSLYDWHDSRYGEVEGKYNDLRKSNSKIADRIAKDPEFAMFMADLADEGVDPRRSIAKIYGLQVDESEETENGYKEYQEQLQAAKDANDLRIKNIQKLKDTLYKFQDDVKASDDEMGALVDLIITDSENFEKGIIPLEYIEYKWKGMKHDEDVLAAAKTGEIKGLNTQIDNHKAARKSAVPDMGQISGTGKAKPVNASTKSSFWEEVKNV